jgi:3-hydroxyisobutyrate dehydrogenase
MSAKPSVAFLGLGIMGQPMAGHLLKAGHPLAVYNRTKAKARDLAQSGARAASTPAEAAAGAAIVISMVTDSPDVEQVLLGPEGAARGAAPGTVFIDMSTINPEAARDIGQRLAGLQMAFLDAPVSGGDVGARNATLTVMAGGERETFDRVRTVFEPLAKRITYVGPSGSGQLVKACNQILCAVNMIAVCEAFGLAEKAGLDLATVLQIVSGGAANSWALENYGPRIIKRDFNPGFMVRLIQKDLNIVQATARGLGLPLAGTALAQQLFTSNQAHGEGNEGIQAMQKVIERLGNIG